MDEQKFIEEQLIKAEAAGGNFGFVAQNIGAIFYAVSLTTYGKTLSLGRYLFATGLIDAFAYIANFQISPEQLADAVKRSAEGVIGLDGCRRQVNNLPKITGNKLLIAFTMQIEMLLFAADTPWMSAEEIVDQVVEQQTVITEMINKTLLEGERCPIFKEVMANTKNFLGDRDFQKIIEVHAPNIPDIQARSTVASDTPNSKQSYVQEIYLTSKECKTVIKYHKRLCKIAGKSKLSQNVPQEVIPALFVLADIVAANKHKNRNIIMQKMLAIFEDSGLIPSKSWLNSRMELYGEIVRGKQLLGVCLRNIPNALKNLATIESVCAVLLSDILLNPFCADNYDGAPYIPYGIGEMANYYKKVLVPLTDCLCSWSREIANGILD